MNVERFMRGKLARYHIHSDYDGDTIAVEPKELLALLRWLQEHEQEIVNDQLANMTHEAESETYVCIHCGQRHRLSHLCPQRPESEASVGRSD